MKKLLLPYLFLLPCFTPLLAQNSQQLAPMPFIMDMVHNNPGETPYVTKYTDGQFLASHGYNSYPIGTSTVPLPTTHTARTWCHAAATSAVG